MLTHYYAIHVFFQWRFFDVFCDGWFQWISFQEMWVGNCLADIMWYHVMSIDVLRFIGIVIVRDIMGIEFVRPFFWYNEDIFWSIASLDELFVGKIGDSRIGWLCHLHSGISGNSTGRVNGDITLGISWENSWELCIQPVYICLYIYIKYIYIY